MSVNGSLGSVEPGGRNDGAGRPKAPKPHTAGVRRPRAAVAGQERRSGGRGPRHGPTSATGPVHTERPFGTTGVETRCTTRPKPVDSPSPPRGKHGRERGRTAPERGNAT